MRATCGKSLPSTCLTPRRPRSIRDACNDRRDRTRAPHILQSYGSECSLNEPRSRRRGVEGGLMPIRPLTLVCLAWLAGGCAAQEFPHPMTAGQMVTFNSPEALVAYLAQPDASAAVCDLRAQGPHFARLYDDVHRALVRGLVEGRIEPRLWRRCIDGALASLPPEGRAELLDAVGKGYRDLLKDGDFERSAPLQARIAAMQSLYLERPPGFDAHADIANPMFIELRSALDRHRLGPIATRFGEELLAAVELERGRYRGRPVDVGVIDELKARADEAE